MTTIATDGRLMAADGRTTAGNRVVNSRTVKLEHLPDGSVIGTAGNVADHIGAVDELALSMREGRPPRQMKGDYALLRLMPDGTVWQYYDRLDGPAKMDAPAAVGSGSSYALGAMAAGMSPQDAIKIAMKFDTGSGGRVRTLTPR